MRTYSLITKPYRIRLKAGMKHTLTNPLTNKFIEFEGGAEFWCAKVYSQDHQGNQSLLLFNHSFFSTFSSKTTKLPEKWDIVDEGTLSWRDDISVLQTSYLAFNCFTDGTIPKFATGTTMLPKQ
jgi:hypothetical protein